MIKIIRGQIVCFGDQPENVAHFEKGALAVSDAGRIAWRGLFSDLPQEFKSWPVEDYDNGILMAGFVDAHLHFPQYRMLAAPAKDLLDWLQRYTFPEEAQYANATYAAAAADVFLKRLFQHGTTSALAFCSSHKVCAEALFGAAGSYNMALVTGKTLMDRNAIAAVHDTVEQGAIDTLALHKAFHGKGRLRHAVTPRFAITSSDAQLQMAGEILRELDGALMQTHISESAGEIAEVARLFPNAKDYTDVYDQFGLMTDRSIFAHGIHLSARERQRFAEVGASVIHCPTSNSFLGSGIMPMKQLKQDRISLGVATDIGGGTSYSMLRTLAETYNLQMLAGLKLSAFELLHMATAENAKRLRIAGDTGSLTIGKFADLVVLDPHATEVLAARQALSQSLEDVLFSLIMLGDDRAITATYVAGKRVHGGVR